MTSKNNISTEKSAEDTLTADFCSLMENVTPIKARNQAVKNSVKPSAIPKFLNNTDTKTGKQFPKEPENAFSEYQRCIPLKTKNIAVIEKNSAGKIDTLPSPPAEAFQGEFEKAVGKTASIDTKNKKWIEQPKPKPQVRAQDVNESTQVKLPSDHVPWLDNRNDNPELVFLRPALEKSILKKLRQGEWPIQASLDFHGNSLDTARERFTVFMSQVEKAGLRCIRLIHGKGIGSKNGLPIIKQTLRAWLIQQPNVLAFCPSVNEPGGAGSTLVLLRQTLKPENKHP